jgi:hypothetical protein
MKRQQMKDKGQEGQQIVLFSVLLLVIVAAGSILASNLLWLRATWTTLQEVTFSAAAAGAAELDGLPGARTLNPGQAGKAARQLLVDNLGSLPFLDEDPAKIGQKANIQVLNPAPGACQPDPLGGPCHEVSFVTIGLDVPVRLPWGGWRLTLHSRAVAEAGESSQ